MGRWLKQLPGIAIIDAIHTFIQFDASPINQMFQKIHVIIPELVKD